MSDRKLIETIIEAAQKRFFAHGFTKVTVDEISTDLRMSKKTLYKIFPSKEAIMREVIHFTLRRIEREVEALVKSGKPFEQKMTELLALMGRFFGRISKQTQSDMQRFTPELWEEIQEFREKHVLSKMTEIFRQAKKEGIFRPDIDIDLFIMIFLHAIQGIMNPYTLAERSYSANEAFRQIFSVLYEGALTDEARKNFKVFEPTYSQPIEPRIS
jgi:AcrR family transcriptional regulator